jgi:hypothetical protein
MNILDAAFHTAHDFPGGVPALALRMGASANVLNKKVNPAQDAHHLRFDEAVKIGQITQDFRILEAHALSLNTVVVRLPDNLDHGDMALLDGFMDIVTELGQFTAAFQSAYRDGNLTCEEINGLVREAADVQSRLAGFVLRLKDMAGE